ncbi:NAD(P)/FAD-dependent oxidoreductase [Luteolibacter flavescens]|uniref:NAD(P)/FAD-dependent oxidoreductase n=1 Tax=Luteolibacter flavescens TaxID=1859460 RepID=A0ABT3FQL7_9BACT|nr:NAD(P)/FAD-dependent oxidoreductase [Luteolibacter flavescens]MCW1885484.1 NAD(P)/FAD-dependent oxidoreductase [Luteolibacter flavescens]
MAGERHFDFVVIGGGSAGYAAARVAREARDNVAIIDGAEHLGGLCILRGCMPSKTLIYSAEVLHLAQRGREFGLVIPEARADMAAMQRRKREVIEDFGSYRRGQLEADHFTLIRERARFVDERTVVLEPSGDRITADHFMISTGSVVNVPDVPGLAETPHWTSDDVLDLDFLPESVIVLGGGIVACELAQFLRRAGSRVIQIQRSGRILRNASEDAAAVVTQAFRDEGIELHTGTAIRGIRREGDQVVVTYDCDGKACEARATHLLNALGRRPALDGLGLEAAGVKTGESGMITVNEHQRTSNPAVYAGGDVTGPHEIVHLAVMQGELAARHATGRPAEPIDYDHLTGVTFTDPQVASAGITPADAEKRGIRIKSATYPFDDHGRSILMGATYGYVKAWADVSTGKLLGAECVGKDAGELIHGMAIAITLGATARDLLRVQWYHPTLSEIWSYPLEDLAGE